MKILPHEVINDKEEEVELCSSVECKGIIGNDGRHYILDLLRTFPPDVNFLKVIHFIITTIIIIISVKVEGMDLSKEATALEFLIEHKHKLSCLRFVINYCDGKMIVSASDRNKLTPWLSLDT